MGAAVEHRVDLAVLAAGDDDRRLAEKGRLVVARARAIRWPARGIARSARERRGRARRGRSPGRRTPGTEPAHSSFGHSSASVDIAVTRETGRAPVQDPGSSGIMKSAVIDDPALAVRAPAHHIDKTMAPPGLCGRYEVRAWTCSAIVSSIPLAVTTSSAYLPSSEVRRGADGAGCPRSIWCITLKVSANTGVRWRARAAVVETPDGRTLRGLSSRSRTALDLGLQYLVAALVGEADGQGRGAVIGAEIATRLNSTRAVSPENRGKHDAVAIAQNMQPDRVSIVRRCWRRASPAHICHSRRSP